MPPLPVERVYLDYAATAPMREEAIAEMADQLRRNFGNPSSTHGFGRDARQQLTRARRGIAECLGVERDQVVFTGNASEANQLALEGSVRLLPRNRRHVLTTAIEHSSVLRVLRRLADRGDIELEMLPIDRWGRIDPAEVAVRLRPETGLCSVTLANNEIGTSQPIGECSAVLRRKGVLLHTDAAQVIGRLAFDFGGLGVDFATLCPHKFGGPKGIGILLRRKGVVLDSPFSADRQEFGLRGGTESVALATGTLAALRPAVAEGPGESDRLTELGTRLRAELHREFAAIVFHSPEHLVLPGLVNFSIPGIEGQWLVAALDQLGIAVSHGAACASLAALPSHVLEAVGAGELARGSVRVSFGRHSSAADLRRLVDALRSTLVDIIRTKSILPSQNAGEALCGQSVSSLNQNKTPR